ncbi:MAG TPA: hypothetical protein VF838_07135 [Trebonia sp.]
MLLERVAQNAVESARERTAERLRLNKHLIELATSMGSVRELRLFGSENELLARQRGSPRCSSAGRAGQGQGGVTILVSHRFSTVLMADRIAVLDHGRLAEFGSHRDLVAADGLYAELFALQARAYGR